MKYIITLKGNKWWILNKVDEFTHFGPLCLEQYIRIFESRVEAQSYLLDKCLDDACDVSFMKKVDNCIYINMGIESIELAKEKSETINKPV